MANTITNISLANTFGDWVSTSVQSTNELNSIGFSDWRKSSGTLYIDSTGTGLDVANNTFLRGGVSITGTNSGLTVTKNAEVRGVLTLSNLDAGNPNKLILSANGVANVNYLNIVGAGVSANVTNDMFVGGTLTVDTLVAGNFNSDANGAAYSTANAAFDTANNNAVSANAVINTANSNMKLYVDSRIAENTAATGVSAGTYGGTTAIPVYTVDTRGRITSSANVSITAGASITDDTSSVDTVYPVLTSQTSGSLTYANTSSTGLTFVPSTGTLSATIFTSLSDESLKENVEPVTNAVDTVKQLNGVSFDWKSTGDKSYGVIAQDIEQVLPDVVQTNEVGIKTVNYQALSAYLIEAIKELSNELDQLKNK